MNKELVISKYKELIDSSANRDWSISELRAFSKTFAELTEQFKKLDTVKRFVSEFDTYANEKQYTEQQMQDLLKFTNIITNYTTGWNTQYDMSSYYKVELELLSNSTITYYAYGGHHCVEFEINKENEKFLITIEQEHNSAPYVDTMCNNTQILKSIYENLRFDVFTYRQFLDMLFDIIKFQHANKYKVSEWRYMRQEDFNHLKILLS